MLYSPQASGPGTLLASSAFSSTFKSNNRSSDEINNAFHLCSAAAPLLVEKLESGEKDIQILNRATEHDFIDLLYK